MKKVVVIIFTMLVQGTIFAQQDAQYTQYMFNTIAVNPAYAGSRGVMSIGGLYRSQWVGLDGAPTTQTINIHSPVSERVGLGLSIVNDEIGEGTNQDTYFDAVFSYTVPTSNTGRLSFGIKAGGHLLNIDFNKLQNFRPELTSSMANIDQRFSPNFGAGIYYYSDNFYGGLSVPNFLETEHFDNSDESSSVLATERLNLYFISGFVFEMSPNLQFKPAVLLKAVQGTPLQADLSANFLFNEKFTFGAAYRWDAAVSGLFGYQLSQQLMLGLAYDREITELGNTAFNNGSFEVFLRYEFRTRFNNVITPRFF